MDRSSRRRVCKAEETISIAKKQHEEKRKKELETYVSYARLHATAVAAIVLSGQPKIDEPLIQAWTRALQYYEVQQDKSYFDDRSRLKKQNAAAQKLVLEILEGAKESERFTEIFRTAPEWLLHFTQTYIDACHLLLDLRPTKIPFTLKWGRTGYEEALGWPLLPLGTMMGGDPLSDEDARRWPLPLRSTNKETETIPDCENIVSVKHGGNDSAEFGLICDMSLAAQVAANPEKEKELSRYQRLRLRRLSRIFPVVI